MPQGPVRQADRGVHMLRIGGDVCVLRRNGDVCVLRHDGGVCMLRRNGSVCMLRRDGGGRMLRRDGGGRMLQAITRVSGSLRCQTLADAHHCQALRRPLTSVCCEA